MDYVYSFLTVYGLLSMYAFLVEAARRRSPWGFIIVFSLSFPILLCIHIISEGRMYRRRKNVFKQNQKTE